MNVCKLVSFQLIWLLLFIFAPLKMRCWYVKRWQSRLQFELEKVNNAWSSVNVCSVDCSSVPKGIFRNDKEWAIRWWNYKGSTSLRAHIFFVVLSTSTFLESLVLSHPPFLFLLFISAQCDAVVNSNYFCISLLFQLPSLPPEKFSMTGLHLLQQLYKMFKHSDIKPRESSKVWKKIIIIVVFDINTSEIPRELSRLGRMWYLHTWISHLIFTHEKITVAMVAEQVTLLFYMYIAITKNIKLKKIKKKKKNYRTAKRYEISLLMLKNISLISLCGHVHVISSTLYIIGMTYYQ